MKDEDQHYDPKIDAMLRKMAERGFIHTRDATYGSNREPIMNMLRDFANEVRNEPKPMPLRLQPKQLVENLVTSLLMEGSSSDAMQHSIRVFFTYVIEKGYTAKDFE